MSLTSYRAAPPRGRSEERGQRSEVRPGRGRVRASGREASRDAEVRGERSEDAGGRPRGRRLRVRRCALFGLRARGQGAQAAGVLLAPSALWSLSSALCSGTPRPTWRRPALPPLGGQYPGRGAVSRPSSEWGRVGPARCDHQVERGVQDQKTENREQRSEGRRRWASIPSLLIFCHWSREADGHGVRGRRSEVGDQKAITSRSGVLYLISVL